MCPQKTFSQNIAAIRGDVVKNPNNSNRHRAQQLDLSTITLQRILTNDLSLHAYKIQLTQFEVLNIFRLDTQAKTSKYKILTKSSLAIKPISISMATLISRTAEHGPITIQGQFSKHKSSTKSDCVVCTLCWRNHWTISFWKLCWKSSCCE